MISLLIGLVIGIVMGFTGAGGALVAIPLFMQFMDMSLKEASVLSLFAVVIASISNFLAQRQYTHYKLGTIIVIASMVGSYLSTPYKKLMPELVVAILLALISLYALFNVWKKSNPITTATNEKDVSFFITLIVGLILGLLTTFTGLGGGVLMVPVLLNVYALGQSRALATSLFAVGLSSLFSLAIQISAGAQINWDLNLIFLVGGIVISAVGLGLISKKISPPQLILIRRAVFTAVVVLALSKIF